MKNLLKVILSCAVIASCTASAPAYAQGMPPNCAPSESAVKNLWDNHGESKKAYGSSPDGKTLMVIFENLETNAFTIVNFFQIPTSNGGWKSIGCVVSGGENFTIIPDEDVKRPSDKS